MKRTLVIALLAAGAPASAQWLGGSRDADDGSAAALTAEPRPPGAALVVGLPEEVAGCYGDCDLNDRYDFFDFLCFQTKFALGDPYADCDGSGRLDWYDFLCFEAWYLYGCGP